MYSRIHRLYSRRIASMCPVCKKDMQVGNHQLCEFAQPLSKGHITPEQFQRWDPQTHVVNEKNMDQGIEPYILQDIPSDMSGVLGHNTPYTMGQVDGRLVIKYGNQVFMIEGIPTVMIHSTDDPNVFEMSQLGPRPVTIRELRQNGWNLNKSNTGLSEDEVMAARAIIKAVEANGGSVRGLVRLPFYKTMGLIETKVNRLYKKLGAPTKPTPLVEMPGGVEEYNSWSPEMTVVRDMYLQQGHEPMVQPDEPPKYVKNPNITNDVHNYFPEQKIVAVHDGQVAGRSVRFVHFATGEAMLILDGNLIIRVQDY